MNISEELLCRDHNTEIRLFDSNGNPKPLWSENRLGRAIRRTAGRELRIPGLTGNRSYVLTNHNLITNVGHAAANARISGQGSYAAFVNLALGISTVSAAATDMALAQEITTNGGQRGAATASQITTTVTNDTTQLQKTWTFTGSFAITEEGIFDATTTPTVTTLSAAVTTTGQTSFAVVSGTSIANNDFIQIESEIVQVTAGGGTTTLTVTRAQKGTTAATHLISTALVDFTAGGGNLLAKQSFAVVNVGPGDSLQLSHTLKS